MVQTSPNDRAVGPFRRRVWPCALLCAVAGVAWALFAIASPPVSADPPVTNWPVARIQSPDGTSNSAPLLRFADAPPAGSVMSPPAQFGPAPAMPLAQAAPAPLPPRPEPVRAPAPAGPAEGANPAVQPGGQRFQALGVPPGLGTPPTPSPQVAKLFDEYVERTVDPQNTMDLVQERPRLLILREAPLRVQIGDEKIASYTLVTDREISIAGHTVGTTVLNLWFPDPAAQGKVQILSYLIRVLPDLEAKTRLEALYKALEGEIAKTFPDSAVRLTLVGDKVAVSGEVKDVIEAAQILRIVAAHAPGNQGQGRGGTDQIPVEQLNINATPQPALPNNPFNPTQQPTLENFLLRDINRQVINLLRIPGEQQVMLRVSVAEVDRTAARSIGMDFTISNAAGQTVFAQATNAVATAGSAMASSGANLPAMIDNGQIALAIRALRTLNLARSLAEPNLVTLNGQPARFRAGGEFPVPSSSVAFGGVGQGVAFVPFGVSLQFIPYITDRDRIRLQVSADVSTLDASLGTSVGGAAAAGGTSVPGIDDRTFESTIEMRQGQTLAVAGLVQNNFTATTNRVPFFGDIPVVGNLFGRNSSTSQEDEVVILITPELVHPLDRCDTPGLPGWDVYEPGDCEFYVLGRLESRRSEDFRASVRTDWERIKRYEHCEDIFIIGAKGHTYGCCDGGACNCGQQ